MTEATLACCEHGLCPEAERCPICAPQLRLIGQTIFAQLKHVAALVDLEDEFDDVIEALNGWIRKGKPGWTGPIGNGAGSVSPDELTRIERAMEAAAMMQDRRPQRIVIS